MRLIFEALHRERIDGLDDCRATAGRITDELCEVVRAARAHAGSDDERAAVEERVAARRAQLEKTLGEGESVYEGKLEPLDVSSSATRAELVALEQAVPSRHGAGRIGRSALQSGRRGHGHDAVLRPAHLCRR